MAQICGLDARCLGYKKHGLAVKHYSIGRSVSFVFGQIKVENEMRKSKLDLQRTEQTLGDGTTRHEIKQQTPLLTLRPLISFESLFRYYFVPDILHKPSVRLD